MKVCMNACTYVLFTYSSIFYGNWPALILLLLTLSSLFSRYISYVRLGTNVAQSLQLLTNIRPKDRWTVYSYRHVQSFLWLEKRPNRLWNSSVRRNAQSRCRTVSHIKINIRPQLKFHFKYAHLHNALPIWSFSRDTEISSRIFCDIFRFANFSLIWLKTFLFLKKISVEGSVCDCLPFPNNSAVLQVIDTNLNTQFVR
jgi:hypothetical protein